MESFGAYLKSLREEKGRSLEAISDSTKIAVANLDFLEKDRYDLLPPRVFVKGFIKSYVQDLDMSPDEALKNFDEFVRVGELPDYSEEEHPVFQQGLPPVTLVHRPWFTLVLTAAGIVSLCILLLTGVTRLFFWDEPAATTVSGAVGNQSIAVVERSSGQGEQGPKQSSFADPPRKKTGKKILEIKAVANTWLRVQIDTGKSEELMMAPGDLQVFTANDSFDLQTGNAGGVRVRFEGRELPVLGKMHQPLSLTLP